MNPRLNVFPFRHVVGQSVSGYVLHLDDAYNKFIAQKTKQSSVAEPTKLLEMAWATAVKMILKRGVDFFLELQRTRADNEWTFADSTAIILLGHRGIILF
jgi:hypothetical protein